MVAIPQSFDPTLAAIDRAIEAKGNRPWRVPSLPMSAIGLPCERAIWYGFRWVALSHFTAAALKRFDDGNHGEKVQANRLQMVEGIQLWTLDLETGKQYEVTFHGRHFKGGIDGVILGLFQAPKTAHVWEHKQVDEKGFRKLEKIKMEKGDKQALREWNPKYWATAQCYMRGLGIDRHYMTVASAGGRNTTSIRTEFDRKAADDLIAKAERIIQADRPPPRVSENPEWYECKFCEFSSVCHSSERAPANCRTCLHSTPIENGAWHCARFDITPDRDEQRMGCRKHLYLPSLIDGEQTDADDDGAWVEYNMRDGSTWRNEVEK